MVHTHTHRRIEGRVVNCHLAHVGDSTDIAGSFKEFRWRDIGIGGDRIEAQTVANQRHPVGYHQNHMGTEWELHLLSQGVDAFSGCVMWSGYNNYISSFQVRVYDHHGSTNAITCYGPMMVDGRESYVRDHEDTIAIYRGTCSYVKGPERLIYVSGNGD
jgi:hypothetical protein